MTKTNRQTKRCWTTDTDMLIIANSLDHAKRLYREVQGSTVGVTLRQMLNTEPLTVFIDDRDDPKQTTAGQFARHNTVGLYYMAGRLCSLRRIPRASCHWRWLM